MCWWSFRSNSFDLFHRGLHFCEYEHDNLTRSARNGCQTPLCWLRWDFPNRSWPGSVRTATGIACSTYLSSAGNPLCGVVWPYTCHVEPWCIRIRISNLRTNLDCQGSLWPLHPIQNAVFGQLPIAQAAEMLVPLCYDLRKSWCQYI